MKYRSEIFFLIGVVVGVCGMVVVQSVDVPNNKSPQAALRTVVPPWTNLRVTP